MIAAMNGPETDDRLDDARRRHQRLLMIGLLCCAGGAWALTPALAVPSWLRLAMGALFVAGFVCLIAATIVGVRALRLKRTKNGP